MRIPALTLTVLALAAPASAQVPDWVTKTKISGLVFGDLYAAIAHHDPAVEDLNGVWIRRIYFTVDHNQSAKLAARVRLEANSPGNFTSVDGSMSPFVKDAYLNWKYSGAHSAVIGLSSAPTFDFIESFWGYRHVEKTPLDLLRFAPSRDLGIAFKGGWGTSAKWSYHGMFANGLDPTNAGKRVMGALRVQPTPAWVFEAYADYDNRTDETDVWTIQGFVGFTGDWGRLGGQIVRQNRQLSATQDLKLDVLSGFVVVKLQREMALIARIDAMFDPNPGGPSIQYFRMSDDANPIFFLVGLDIPVLETFSIIPNVEVVTYNDPVAGATTPDADVFLKGTFSWTF